LQEQGQLFCTFHGVVGAISQVFSQVRLQPFKRNIKIRL
jgi:hypothetical protein